MNKMKRIVLFLAMCFRLCLLSGQSYIGGLGIWYDLGANVFTCKNGVIETTVPRRELNATELGFIYNALTDPNGEYVSLGITPSDIVAQPTAYYNCHAFAFHLTEGNTKKVWINDYKLNGGNNLSTYWDSNVGCFYEVFTEAEADKVVYGGLSQLCHQICCFGQIRVKIWSGLCSETRPYPSFEYLSRK